MRSRWTLFYCLTSVAIGLAWYVLLGFIPVVAISLADWYGPLVLAMASLLTGIAFRRAISGAGWLKTALMSCGLTLAGATVTGWILWILIEFGMSHRVSASGSAGWFDLISLATAVLITGTLYRRFAARGDWLRNVTLCFALMFVGVAIIVLLVRLFAALGWRGADMTSTDAEFGPGSVLFVPFFCTMIVVRKAAVVLPMGVLTAFILREVDRFELAREGKTRSSPREDLETS